jgi:hypothetical protein
VILSCALFKQYLPLLVVATYVLAPLPNWICGRCANPDDFVESSGNALVDFGRFCTGFLIVMGIGMCTPSAPSHHIVFSGSGRDGERFVDERGDGLQWDMCYVLWMMNGTRGVYDHIYEWMLIWCTITALPAVLAHSEIIRIPAMIMSITGGLLIYGTIISFGMFFQEEQEF